MQLPELPKQNKMSESSFGIRFRRWWEKRPQLGTYELKHCRSANRIPFNAVTDEQIAFALAVRSPKGVLVRVQVGTTGTADYIGLCNTPSWIVCRYDRSFEIISIDTFLLEKSRSKRKSLTAERARSISTLTVKL